MRITRRLKYSMDFSLLVVCGVAATAFLYYARGAALRAQCGVNLHFLAIALSNYHSRYHSFPIGTISTSSPIPEKRLGLFVVTWPYTGGFGQSKLVINNRESWDSPSNLKPRGEPVFVDDEPDTSLHPVGKLTNLQCPEATRHEEAGRPSIVDYVGVAGLGLDAPSLPKGHKRCGVFGYDRATRREDITDGTASTMFLIETSIDRGPWTAGGRATIRGLDPERPPYIGAKGQFGGFHSGGAMVLFADGSVRFISERVDPKVFEAMSTIAGGERVPPNVGTLYHAGQAR